MADAISRVKMSPDAQKFLSSEEKLKKRPRFTQVVGRSKPLGYSTNPRAINFICRTLNVMYKANCWTVAIPTRGNSLQIRLAAQMNKRKKIYNCFVQPAERGPKRIWNERESYEWDWGETLKIRSARLLAKIRTVLQSKKRETVLQSMFKP
ncbi:TeTratriCopeptide repeat [Desmophyllum pertusum]|uniref:TeTratriCopeptide repeat n=1 Tax=Desmophyllum pertusum TaxID=174260 RepID=A0A9W9Z840_9CNID|nr:TeTratriCopeptide repeat [Desmophyllum pertusum]